MGRKVLMINPGYYETGDYGYSYMPNMGLLKIGRYFRSKGINTKYIDFCIPIRLHLGDQTLKNFYTRAPFVRWAECGNFKSEGIAKQIKYYGMPHDQIKQIIKEQNPTEIWLGTGLTYYWESVKDLAVICKNIYPKIPLLLGGIYATLWPEHARTHIPCDMVHIGPIDDIDDLMPDYDLDENKTSVRVIQTGKGCHIFPPCSFCSVISLDPKFKPIAPDRVFNYIQEEMEIGGKKRIIIKETCTTCDCIIWERFTEYTMPRRKIDTSQFGTVSNTSSIQ